MVRSVEIAPETTYVRLRAEGQSYTARLEPMTGPGEEGWWLVRILELDGCTTQGQGFEEAVHMAREALADYLHATSGG